MSSKQTGVCPICGGTNFSGGPNGRMSPGGLPPRCIGCGSLERHRAYRTVFDAIAPVFATASVLQFSDDPSARRDRYASFEMSVFGGENHLDMSAIDRPDGTYDLVIANHVLEHVADDLAAMAELDRVTSHTGIVFLSVPDLLRNDHTVEYGEARADKHGHWRIYGPDIRARWLAAVPTWHGIGVMATDPVTGEADRATLLSRSTGRLRVLSERLVAEVFTPFDAFA